MHLSEILSVELEEFSKRAGNKALGIVETGSIRGDGENYRINDGWSTVFFAEWVKKNAGALVSIDLDTSTAEKVLKKKKLAQYVQLVQGHSIEELTKLFHWKRSVEDGGGNPGAFDVAFLDSDNDGALIFHEYLIVKQIMASPGLIIVDDVDIESDGVVKGHEILPWVIANNIPHRIIRRESEDYQTGVLVFDV